MSPRTASEMNDLISRALCEVLDSVIAPRMREIVIDDALALSHEAELPTDPDLLVSFIRGSLRDALLQAVGEESVDAITVDLERIVALAAAPPSVRPPFERGLPVNGPPSCRRRRTPSSRPRMPAAHTARSTPPPHARAPTPRATFRTAPTPRFPTEQLPPRSEPSVPPISSGRYPMGAARAIAMAGVNSSRPPDTLALQPVVVVASLRSNLAQRLARSLSSRVEIVTIQSIFELVAELRHDDLGRVALLIDCDAPAVRPIAVAALADDLPASVQVVLWGATPALKASLIAVSPRCQTWIGIDVDSDVDDVAGRCAMLVG